MHACIHACAHACMLERARLRLVGAWQGVQRAPACAAAPSPHLPPQAPTRPPRVGGTSHLPLSPSSPGGACPCPCPCSCVCPRNPPPATRHRPTLTPACLMPAGASPRSATSSAPACTTWPLQRGTPRRRAHGRAPTRRRTRRRRGRCTSWRRSCSRSRGCTAGCLRCGSSCGTSGTPAAVAAAGREGARRRRCCSRLRSGRWQR